MSKALTKIEYREYDIHPDQTGWYIMEFASHADFTAATPCDVVGPFLTRTAAIKMLDTPDEEPTETSKHGVSNRKPYDPANDPTPASFAATASDPDADDLDEYLNEEPTDKGNVV